MEYPALSIGQIHFKFKDCWAVVYNFIQILKVHSVLANIAESVQTLRSTASDWVLLRLHMFHKIGARLIWVNLLNMQDKMTVTSDHNINVLFEENSYMH